MRYDVLIEGFPGRTRRGFLGWSSTILLDTDDGYALFDTGSHGDRPALMAGLHERGIASSEIRTVVLSHLHFDHVANVECFPEAEVILHEEELAYFQSHRTRDPALPIFCVEGILRRPRLTLASGELEVLPGIRMIRTPGHTGGHCSLVLSADHQRVVLAQDAIKHREEARTLQPAGAVSDREARASIRRILSIADVVVPGHDAPFRVENGKVGAVGTLREEITVTLDGRTIALEV